MTLEAIANSKMRFEERTALADFVAIASLLLRSTDSLHARALSEDDDRYSGRVQEIFYKAEPGMFAAPGGSPATWGAQLAYENLSGAFLESLHNSNVFDTAAPFMRRAPLSSRVGISHSAAAGYIIGEGAAKQLSTLEFDDQTLSPLKAVAMLVISKELAQLGGPLAEAIIETELRNGVSAATDDKFLADLIAATTPGASSDDFMTDLGVLLSAISGNASSRYFVVIDVPNAKRLATLPGIVGPAFPNLTPNGGTIAGVTVLPSDQLSTGQVVCFDATQIAADPGVVALDASENAVLDMAGGNTPTLSLYQKNLRALRAERHFGFKPLRSTAIASLTGAAYVAESPA